MTCRHRGILTLILMIASVSGESHADSMRCGDNIVQRGYTFFEVLERCGKPDLQYDWDHRYVPGVEAKSRSGCMSSAPTDSDGSCASRKGDSER